MDILKLSEKQMLFSRDVGCLLEFAYQNDFGLTFGEAYRPLSQVLLNFYGYSVVKVNDKIELVKRPPTSQTLSSLHQERLGVDFNIFVKGRLLNSNDWDLVKPLGDYWVSLSEKNRWGGDFNMNGKKDGFIDLGHFERRK